MMNWVQMTRRESKSEHATTPVRAEVSKSHTEVHAMLCP
jgi:hypothetical protein